MSPFARLRSVRNILVIGVVVRAICWGATFALAMLVAGALIDLHVGFSMGERYVLTALNAVAFFAVAGALLWRDRSVLKLHRVALWIEEHDPSLEYRLVTAVESRREAFVPNAATEGWASTARSRSGRAVAPALAAVVVAFVAPSFVPSSSLHRLLKPTPGDALDRPGRAGANASRLTPLVAQVEPPAYSGEKPTSVDEPSDIRTLVGSTITLRGRGDPAGIIARADTATLTPTSRGDRWSMTYKVGAKPVAVRLSDGHVERIVAIEPIIDNPPTVTLITPAHDSILRTPHGRIPLSADVNDDFGVATASFEFIVSSGEGETFTFKSGTLGNAKLNGRRGSITGALSLDSLELKPGDIVHLRAVARDANNVTGPGLGTSETRAIRIARTDEYDSVAVDAAPPTDADKSVLSERMLIMLAEELQKKRPSMKRDAVVGESRGIATDQKRLRRNVGEIVFTRLGGDPTGEEHSDDDPPQKAKTMEEMLARADSATNISGAALDFEGGESPVVAVNKPLLEAYNAMWDASTELELGEPAKALPHMRVALAAIQKARQAERLYLRGQPPAVIVDLNKVRLTGKDKGTTSKRRPLVASDSANQARADRFVTIAELASHAPAAAADSLLLLRIDVLSDNPALASALSDAANALRRGKSDEATLALTRARRTLSGAPVARDSIARWGIVP
ncbi:MAG TPA: DUF4175 family protein [Gemmatimonadaceae bacterium]|jgi:hypothetical protein